MVVAIHDPIPTNYSIDTLCERFRAIELRKELRTTRWGGTADDPVALLAKQKGRRAGSPMPGKGMILPMARRRKEKECVGDVARRVTVSTNVARRNRRREDRILGDRMQTRAGTRMLAAAEARPPQATSQDLQTQQEVRSYASWSHAKRRSG